MITELNKSGLAEYEEETWLVHPTPGICLKFRNVYFPGPSLSSGTSSSNKFFINLAHCIEMPPPKEFLDEDAVAKLLESDPNAFQIPISVAELDPVVDHNGNSAMKITVLVNSDFFHRCIRESEFFKQITLRIICDMIETKYGIRIDISTQVALRNRKCMGELRTQRLRKRPLNSVLDLKMNPKVAGVKPANETGRMDIDDIEETGPRKPRNFKVQIVGGQMVDIKVKVKDGDGKPVNTLERLVLKMNDSRVVILLDSLSTAADFQLPFRMKDEEAECRFEQSTSTMSIKCPLDWR